MVTFLAFIVVLGVLIFFHEFGHFIMAKWVGIRVERFSLGFGPKLLGFKQGDTEYMISAFPLGGYIKMSGENPDEPLEGKPYEFGSRSVWERTKVIVCGPGMNLILAIFFLCLPFIIGRHVPAYLQSEPVIGWIDSGSPAENSGFQIGDKVMSVDGRQVPDWMTLEIIVATNSKRDMTFIIDRAGERLSIKVTTEELGSLGIGSIGIDRYIPPIIGELNPGYPAEKAGLQVGDAIIAIDDQPIHHWYQLANNIHESPDIPITLTIERAEKTFDVSITPTVFYQQRNSPVLKRLVKWFKNLFVSSESDQRDNQSAEDEGQKFGLIGISPHEETVIKKYGLMASIKKGGSEFIRLLKLTFEFLYKLVAGRASLKSLGGPIMIAKVAGEVAKTGIGDLIYFMGFLSLQLGILNLFPIPVLDGGHLLFFGLEAIKGAPLSFKTREKAQQIGFILLMVLMVYVFYNDIMRYFFR